MNQRTLVLAIGLGLSGPSLQAAELHTAIAPIQGQYIVVLKDDVARLAEETGQRPTVEHVVGDIARRTRGIEVLNTYRSVLRGFAARADDAALAQLMADPRVAYVEEDSRMSVSGTQRNATWGLDRIDQRNLPLDTGYRYATTADGVHAYIIDTGILGSHTEFNGRVASGFSTIDDGQGTRDCHGHGTHVAGTVGGATWGVAKGVTLYPVRVLGCDGSGSNSGVIAGMDWVAQNHAKPAVANMSLGGGVSKAIDQAVARMVKSGVTVTVAAGNADRSACQGSPARAPLAITVGATTSSDARSSFSNFGKCVDLFAPGSAITSAWATDANATRTISGTSMAAPHVAGAAALYLASHPTANPVQVTASLLAASSQDRVADAGRGSPNRLLYTGPDSDERIAFLLDEGIPLAHLAGNANEPVYGVTRSPGAIKYITLMLTGQHRGADLYVKFGQAPTTTDFDCHAQPRGADRICRIENPQAGDWYIMVRGNADYSGATLKVQYD